MAMIATHFEGLSESISIDDGVGARDKWRRECKFPLKNPAILRLRLILGGLLLDTMIGQIRVCSSHDNFQFYLVLICQSTTWILRWRLRWRPQWRTCSTDHTQPFDTNVYAELLPTLLKMSSPRVKRTQTTLDGHKGDDKLGRLIFEFWEVLTRFNTILIRIIIPWRTVDVWWK